MKVKNGVCILIFSAILISQGCTLFGGGKMDVVYVSPNGMDNTWTNGGSPSFPLKTIGAASTIVVENGKILVSEGTYEDCGIHISDIGFEVYGGYNSDFTERDPSLHPTILIPRQDEENSHGVNSYKDSVVDGFTLRQAVNFCISISSESEDVTLTLNNCIIENNSASWGAAVIAHTRGKLIMTHCTITGNTGGSGGVYLWNKGTAAISDCTISNNRGDTTGSIDCSQGDLTLSRCTITGNSPNHIVGNFTDGGGNTLE